MGGTAITTHPVGNTGAGPEIEGNGGADMAGSAPRADQDRAADAVRLRLLGAFALTVGGREVPLRPNSCRLLAYLAVQRHWVPRSTAAGTLWPGADPAHAAGNLRSTLWRITRSVGRVVVTVRAHSLRLDDAVDVDLERVERAARCQEPVVADVRSLGLDLLPDWDDEWVEVHRECFRQVRLRALESLCAQHRRTGRLRQALDLALAAVSAEPLRESAHRQLVEVHLAEGNAAEAVRQYQFYRHMLDERLGLGPSPAMHRLVAPLLANAHR